MPAHPTPEQLTSESRPASEGLTLRRLTSFDEAFQDVCQLLADTFIDDEQRSMESLRTVTDCSPLFGLHAVERDGRFAGMVSTWNFGKYLYVEHLAIVESLRGQGLGTSVMGLVCQRSGLPMVLEIDLPGLSTEAARREAFYERLGFHAWSAAYQQPPYGPGKNSVPMELMARGLEETPECVAIVVALLRRHVYGIKGA